MPFELFTNDKAVPRGEPMVTISSYGRVAINKVATARLEHGKVTHVQLLWDKEERRIAIRPSGKEAGAFTLSKGMNGNGSGFTAVSFLTYITYDYTETRNFMAEWDESAGMYVFEIPAEHIGKTVPSSYLTNKTARRAVGKTAIVPEDGLENA